MAFGRRRHEAGRPWRLSARWLILCSLIIVAGFVAICVDVVMDLRRGEEALVRRTLENLASGIDADISRNIELYDLSLRAVATSMVMPEIKNVSKPIRQLILFDRAASAKHFGAIQVFDANGKLIVDASSLDPQPENRSDEEYFKIHREHPDIGLFISRPMLHRGAYSIVLSRRITGADGSFLGVVVGSIRFSYFHELFDRLQFAPSDSITVLRDGSLVGEYPTRELLRIDLVHKMLGREAADMRPRTHVNRATTSEDGPFLVGEGITNAPGIVGADVELYEGEVLGVAGLLGSGRTELARAITGVDRLDTGHVRHRGARRPPRANLTSLIQRRIVEDADIPAHLSKPRRSHVGSDLLRVPEHDSRAADGCENIGLLHELPAGRRTKSREMTTSVFVR